MSERAMPAGFVCSNPKCGKRNEFGAWVAAHWRELLSFTCDCGQKYKVILGVANSRKYGIAEKYYREVTA